MNILIDIHHHGLFCKHTVFGLQIDIQFTELGSDYIRVLVVIHIDILQTRWSEINAIGEHIHLS
ncbi:hypothetical protein EYS14_06520 [Alteromonadaceae bacterium M269]|nr:hypothetical protein EYS14_06520 [Alteromonadaceae bacterium M269]